MGMFYLILLIVVALEDVVFGQEDLVDAEEVEVEGHRTFLVYRNMFQQWRS